MFIAEKLKLISLRNIRLLSPNNSRFIRRPFRTMNAENFVESALKSKKVVIFSKSYCPYCDKAKQTMAKFNLSKDVYEVFEIDQLENTDAIQDYLLKKTGARSVPRVFIGGKFIGGGDDTVRLAQSGELKQLLENAGAV